jgi:transposase
VERRLRWEEVVTIEVLHERGMSNRAIARQLGVHEHAVRYRLARLASGAPDGRAKPFAAEPWAEAIGHWMGEAEARRGVNLQELYAWLVAEQGYAGSYKAVQRFVRAKYPKPKLRVRRRVETPPGAQAQADWATFRGLVVGGIEVELHAFHLVLSHSRMEAIVWSERQDELAWLAVHNEALRRLGGVPAVIRVDSRPLGRAERTLRGHHRPELPAARARARGERSRGDSTWGIPSSELYTESSRAGSSCSPGERCAKLAVLLARKK